MRFRLYSLTLIVAQLFAAQAFAFDVAKKEIELPSKLKQAIEKVDFGRYRVRPQPEKFDYGFTAPPALPGWREFTRRYQNKWRLEIDARTKVPLLIEGKGVPWIPGKGNRLTRAAFGPRTAVDFRVTKLSDIEQVAQAFMTRFEDLLKVQRNSLIFDKKISNGFGKNNRYWSLKYQLVYKDSQLGVVPVRGAYVFFRISHGNLVQFGNQLAVAPQGINTAGILPRESVKKKALELFGNPAKAKVLDPVRDLGQSDKTLQIVPINLPDGSIGHQLVRAIWVISRPHSIELWFDAQSGELVYAINKRRNSDAQVRGGIYPVTNTDPEVLRGLPRVEVTNDGASKTTDESGIYDYDPPGSLSSCSIEGPYVRVVDDCGTSSVSTSLLPGDLSFGSGAGTDCSTPGFGGAGNTHAARSSFYHLNLIKEKVRYYLDVDLADVDWLNDQLDSETNLTGDCNAYWNGASLEFYREFDLTAAYGIQCPTDASLDYICSNTGEISAIFLHEFGHGLDDNTNGAPPENGSGEAYADTMAFLQTHDPCIGNNFAQNCSCPFGCDASCTGVRNVNVTPEITPANIEMAPADCDRWDCPYFISGFWPYQGPMGYEGHCESLVASGAVWDMIEGFVDRYGNGAGWALGDRIWYESLNDTESAYQVVSGGTCNPAATVDGCGADNWYTVFLALDDDNGDLTDGTPNAGIIWDAFNAHGIACGATAPAESTSCPTLATPTLTAVAGTGQVQLDWTAVTDAASYRIYRNEFSCNSGFTPIADLAAPTVSYTDTTISNGTTYYYAVQAIGTDDLCVSAFSSCISATPTAPLQPANVFMVLDQSGSMSGATDLAGEQKIDALKDASNMVLDVVEDYAGDGFRIGAVSFSTDVTGDTGGLRDPSDMAPGGDREILDNFVSALSPTNLTAIGKGVNQAVAGFPDPSDGKRKAIMLLSDGMQNVAPMLQLQVPPPGVAVGGTDLPDDVLFYTVALGTQIQEDLFDDLANQGGIPGFYYSGGTADIQNNFAFWVADILGLAPAGSPFAPRGGGSLVATSTGSSSSSDSGNSRAFSVNRSVRRVTFLLTWQAKGRDLRFYLDTPLGRIDPPSSSFHAANGYASYTVRFPLKGHDPQSHVGQWTLRVYESSPSATSTNSSAIPEFKAHALFDDPAIKLEYTAGGADPGAGESLPFELRISENGIPLSDIDVKVSVEGPETGLGELLSEATIDDPKLMSAMSPGKGDPYPDKATQKLMFLLQRDPDFIKMLPGNTVSLTEKSHGIYRGSLPANKTVAAGTYVLTFEISGKGNFNDTFFRSNRFSRYLRLKPDAEHTEITAEIVSSDADTRTVLVKVVPRDKAGNRLGPGWGSYIKASTSVGSFVGTAQDNLDGSYTLKLAAPDGSDPDIRIVVFGETIADTNLNALLVSAPTRYSLSVHAGATVPIGNFNNDFNTSFHVAIDFEYHLIPQLSVMGLLGLSNFASSSSTVSDTYWIHLSANLKYTILSSSFSPYIDVGPGLYIPEQGSIRFGLNTGLGLQYSIKPSWQLQAGADYHHAFVSGNDLQFFLPHLGLLYSF